nr:putative rab geranylgeranyltransferase c15c4.03 [Quercus suber]
METLNDTSWDVVIDGTDLPQSLLALALSRAGYRILHLDHNQYYGGKEAALSLDEAEKWAKKFQGEHGQFRRAVVTRPREDGAAVTSLANSRAYTLSLSPQLIYGRSNLLQALVSSRTHEQLDFQAVGSFWIVEPSREGISRNRVLRVPSGREDIFQDKTISLRAKRSLMNFIRSITVDRIASEQLQAAVNPNLDARPFLEVLREDFNFPPETYSQLLGLTLSAQPPNTTTYKEAVSGIKRHLLSMGMFGSGFAAVMPKYGGLSEVVQVACRAGAVGGGVYVLGKSITSSTESDKQNTSGPDLKLELTGGETISTRWLIKSQAQVMSAPATITAKSISIIDSTLTQLFPPTSIEGGVTPAGAVILMPASNDDDPPTHVLVHSASSGECPENQCILYASVLCTTNGQQSVSRLEEAIDHLLRVLNTANVEDDTAPEARLGPTSKLLWRLSWEETHQVASVSNRAGECAHEICIPPLSANLALEDTVLENVQSVWQTITGGDDTEFMTFAAREEAESDM